MSDEIGTDVLKHYLHLYETFEKHPEVTAEFLALDERLSDKIHVLIEEVLEARTVPLYSDDGSGGCQRCHQPWGEHFIRNTPEYPRGVASCARALRPGCDRKERP